MKKIVIGLLLCSWALIAYLITRNSVLSTNLQNAENNIVALTDTLYNEACAYQTTIGQLELRNKALYDSLKIDKHTKEIVRIKVKSSTKDTVLIPVKDTVLRIKEFRIDTTLNNDWRTLHLTITPDSSKKALLRLSDEVTVYDCISYKVEEKKVLVKQYRWKLWGKLFGKKIKVKRVVVTNQNPLIEIIGTNYIDIIED